MPALCRRTARLNVLADYRAAEATLAKRDPLMRRLIAAQGSCTLQPDPRIQPFVGLVRAIAHQQLHAKAAEAILRRFGALYPRGFPSATQLLATPPEQLRACGFSASKIAALQDIAQHRLNGIIPTRAALMKLDDETIITRLLPIRGVGRWTIEMLLIFQLGRLDVLPADDFGVRHGFMVAQRLDQMPTPRALKDYGTIWQPYRTIAAWHLWRAADTAKKIGK